MNSTRSYDTAINTRARAEEAPARRVSENLPPDWKVLHKLWTIGSDSLYGPRSKPSAIVRLVRSTNYFMVSLILLFVTLTVLLGMHFLVSAFAVFLLVFALQLFKVQFPFLKGLGGFIEEPWLTDRSTISRNSFKTGLLNRRRPRDWRIDQRLLFKAWLKLQYVSPFSLQNIWWFTVVLGLIPLLGRYAPAFRSPVNNADKLDKIGIGVSTILVIAIVTYIATNLLSQIFYLEGRFGVARKETKGLVKDLRVKSGSIQESTDQLKLQVRRAIGFLDAGSAFIEFDREFSRREGCEREAAGRFISEIADSVTNFRSQVSGAPQDSQLFILLALTEYMRRQSHLLNTSQRYLLTSFSHLAKIVSSFANAAFEDAWRDKQDQNLEFYALLVLPPERFLNYSEEEKDGKPTRSLGDWEWEEYLRRNRELASGNKIKQVRHFLVLKGINSGNIATAGKAAAIHEELISLEEDKVRVELDSWVRVDDKNVPVIWDPSTDQGVGDPSNHPAEHRSRFRYDIRKTKPTVGEGEKWIQLRAVLDKVYHRKGSCFVREYGWKEYLEECIDQRFRKPIDYFAIRQRGNWSLCFRTLYDKTFDVAQIEIVRFENKRGRETEVAKELDSIFLTEGLATPIAEW